MLALLLASYLLGYLGLRVSGLLYVDPYGFYRGYAGRTTNIIAPSMGRLGDPSNGDLVVLLLWYVYLPLHYPETRIRNLEWFDSAYR